MPPTRSLSIAVLLRVWSVHEGQHVNHLSVICNETNAEIKSEYVNICIGIRHCHNIQGGTLQTHLF